MANYSDIINEFETVANAFVSVNYFRYDRVSSMNGKQKDKAYPMILVNSTPNTNIDRLSNDYLPRGKRFTFNFFCYNLYNTSDKESETLQKRQSTVDNILDQYVAELVRRNIDGSNGFSIVTNTGLSGFLAHDVHNDRLVQSTYTVIVELDTDCTTGTFNY
jgi:hypothetical protein